MKRLKMFGIIAFVGLLFAPAAVFGGSNGPPSGLDVNVTNTPLPVTVQPDGLSVNVSTVYQFAGYVGYDMSNLGDGILGMHQACQAQFSDLARTCTSKEFWTSPSARAPGSGPGAWIQPSIVAVGKRLYGDKERPYALDFTGTMLWLEGTQGTKLPTCDQWNMIGDDNYYGTVVDSGGSIQVRHCDPDTGGPTLLTCCTPAYQ